MNFRRALVYALLHAGHLLAPLSTYSADPVDVRSSHCDEGQPPRGATGQVSYLATPLYLACVDAEKKVAVWVSYRLTPAQCDGRNVLMRNWHTTHRDISLEDSDYSDSGYDRGHLVALSLVSASPHAWQANDLAVIAPQRPDLNRGAWKALEADIRPLIYEHGEVFVVTGSVWEDDMEPLRGADESHQVPSHFWMLLRYADLQEAYLFPQDAALDAQYETFAVTVSQLEKRTGLDLTP